MKATGKVLTGLALATGLTTGLFFCAVSGQAQSPPPSGYNEPTNTPLASWSFQDTTNWTSDLGYTPVSFTNLNTSYYGDGNTLVVDTNVPAWLQYNVCENDGTTNLTVNQGSVTFWFAANWSSTNQGGTGPGDWAQLFDAGEWTTNSSYGYWGLSIDPPGQNLWFMAQDGAGNTYTLSTPASWTTNYFHFIALTYSGTNVSLYWDGQLATNDADGLSIWPGSGVISNGMFFGSDTNGLMQAHGLFNMVATYNYPLNSNDVQTIFDWEYSSILIDPYNAEYMEAASYQSSSTSYGTNLAIGSFSLSNNLASLFMVNSTADVLYEIQGTTNLAYPNWTSLGFVYGSELTNLTLASVMVSNKPTLFLRIRSWMDDGSGLPIWWQLQYFGTNGVDPYGDPAGDGWNNLEKFQLGMNPTDFYTPPAPQNLTMHVNNNTLNVSLSWQANKGNVSQYEVDEVGQQGHGSSSILGYTSQTTFTATLDKAYYGTDFSPPIFIVKAVYTNAASSASAIAPMELSAGANSVQIIQNYQGYDQLMTGNLPPDATTIRLFWVTNFIGFLGIEQSVSYDISVSNLVNGIYLLPTGLVETNRNIRYIQGQGYPFVDILHQSGQYDYDGFTPAGQSSSSAWLNGLARFLKNNLDFLLRSATINHSFSYTSTYPSSSSPLSRSEAGPAYEYSGYRYYDTIGQSLSIDTNRPVEENYLWRNFAYVAGDLNTGASYSGGRVAGNAPGTNRPEYEIPTNQLPLVSLPTPALADNTASFYYYGTLGYAPYTEIGLALNGSGYFYLPAGLQNIYGLPILAVKDSSGAEVDAGVPASTSFGSLGVQLYVETAFPSLATADYYFASQLPVPGTPGFTPGNAPPVIAAVGQNLGLMAWARQSIGTSGKYAYLEQFFDQAYQVNSDGAVTTNVTEFLSSYGSFTATNVGPVAIVTMPDIDSGQRGTGIVYCVSLALDANHDGTMDTSFSGPDFTTQNKPFVFWVNNNYDRWNTALNPAYVETEQDDVLPGNPGAAAGQDDDPNDPDCNYKDLNDHRAIPDTRDLEDFARLWVCGITPDLESNLPPGSTIKLSWGDIGNPNPNNPTIDVFQAAAGDGGIGYLTNETTANLQIGSGYYVQRIGPGQGLQEPAYMFDSGHGLNHLIWCGVSNGIGQLTMTVADSTGTNILGQASAWIQIVDIKQLYERWTVGDNPNKAPLTVATNATDNLPTNAMQQPFVYLPPQSTNTPYILFVHGYNLGTWEKDRYAETAFKRLYWQGYQGRFGEFRWPDVNNALQFDFSEQQAWESDIGLLNLLAKLNAEYPNNVYLFAHSQGNVVAGEALKEAGTNYVVNTYIAAQAAVPAHCYDPTTPVRSIPGSLDWGAPDRHAYYPTNGGVCYFNGIHGAGTFINFYNTNDWALTFAWPTDQNSKKAVGVPLGYAFSPPESYYDNITHHIYFPANTFEIYAQIIQARCNTLGAQQNVGGAFTIAREVNLPSVWPPDPANNGYSAHLWHSAEFRSDYPQRWLFWDEVLFQMRIKGSL